MRLKVMLRNAQWMGVGILVVGTLIAGFFIGCARAPIRDAEQAMRPIRNMPQLDDDLEFASLLQGLEADVRFLRGNSKLGSSFNFGPRKIAKEEYLRSLEVLLNEGKQDPTGARFRQVLRENFEAFEVYGRENWGEIFMTSYFEPVIAGSRKPSAKFSQPLYGVPKDLVVVDMAAFAATFPSLNSPSNTEQKSKQSVLRGRLVPTARTGEPARIVPFYDRKQIDSDNALKTQNLELAWVDPVDSFFLQIQGSGVVTLDDGSELRVGYAAQNGHPYVAIGAHLLNVIPKEKMSMRALEAHLRSLPRAEMQKILELNPSYVFFQQLPGAGQTFLGTEVVPGRTIATDHTYFPKGTLAFLQYDRPVFATNTDVDPVEWKKSSRFVLDQDTGGAIRGPGRLDLFWGRGDAAKQAAGVIKNTGRLYYFVPKVEFVQKLMSAQQASAID